MDSLSLKRKAREVLEWPLLIEALAHEATSDMGAKACKVLPLATHLAEAERQQHETAEMVQVLQGDHPFPPLNFLDIQPSLERAEKGGQLEGVNFRDIGVVLRLGRVVKKIVHLHQQGCPNLFLQFSSMEDTPHLEQTIEYCIDEHGQLRESASPELRNLTHQSQVLRQRIRQRLEGILSSSLYADVLQGHYFAERANRYVIPVKAERQHDLDGIVHDISSSGATVFIEPRPLIELNNAIKFADLQVAQEVRRILSDLSAVVGEASGRIRQMVQALVQMDCLMAKARLSIKIQGHPIRLNHEQRIHLRHARHPLLTLSKDHVVPNTIHVGQSSNMLIISGPNAGGKTVTLKLVGLVGLMAKVGLHPPCAPDSEMAWFDQIYADIGEAQDLSRDLSSFSGHLLHIIALLQDLERSKHNGEQHCLVLLDEIGSSTDPVEGAALAEALLNRLNEFGCTILATTHYPSIKTLALRQPHVRNVSQEFDLDTLSPTFRLLDGIPGGSSALEIAGRLGLEPAIIDRARTLIQRQDQDLDQAFRSLNDLQSQLEESQRQAHKDRETAQRLREEAEAIRTQLRIQEQEDRRRYRKQWLREFSHAQRQANLLVEDLKKEKTPAKLRATRQSLESLHQHMQSQLPSAPAPSLGIPQKGDLVEIEGLGTVGTLMDNVGDTKYVSIQAGGQTIKAPPSSLQLIKKAQVHPSTSGRISRSITPSQQQNVSPPLASSGQAPLIESAYQHQLDLRGSRLEEALESTMMALDRALRSQAKFLKIIHGKGTGVLRAGIRKFCQDSPYAEKFRTGEPSEGGDGVTIIELT